MLLLSLSLSRLLLALVLLIPPPTSSSPNEQRQQCGARSDGEGGTATCAPSSRPGEGSTADPPPAPPPRLPDDFVDPCHDTGDPEGCPRWASEGECESNPPYMLVSCAKSCGTCRPVGVGGGPPPRVALSAPCRDERSECAGWAGTGECSVNPTYMHVRCQYSCWECVDDRIDREAGVSEDIIAKKLLYSEMNTGVHQLIRKVSNGSSDFDGNYPAGIQPDRESVLRTVREMDKYAKYIITHPLADDKARERCRNEFRMCAEWAAGGACPSLDGPLVVKGDGGRDALVAMEGPGRNDALFMMNHCPLACGACGELESFHRCTGRRRSGERPSFRSGAQLISFLEGRRNSPGDWDRYRPVFASHPNSEEEGRGDDPHVVIFQRFLSDEEVDALHALASDIGWGRGGRVRCHDDLRCDLDPTYRRVMERISTLTNTTTSHLEPMRIGHHGRAPPQHNFRADGLWKPSGPRVLSLFVFLSGGVDEEVAGAGALGFPFLDWLRIRPRRGAAVLFTNVRGDELFRPEPLTSFEQLPPRGGGEAFFGASVHVRLYNYMDAKIRGCA